jgi:predicted glycosyltransferase
MARRRNASSKFRMRGVLGASAPTWRAPGARSPAGAGNRSTIWIDLENTPHVPFFRPIIRELESSGHAVVITARDAFQTCELADDAGMRFRRIGRHYGRRRAMKVAGLAIRTLQLLPFALRERPRLAVSHGSRAQLLACRMLGIPSVLILDYEHARMPRFLHPTWELMPAVVPSSDFHCRAEPRKRRFRGIKEDVYVPELRPDPAILARLGVHGGIVATVRPPASEAHYHNPDADHLFVAFVDRICAIEGVTAVLLPRNRDQANAMREQHPRWFASGKVVVPAGVVDGINLVWHSDLVVSGGGTMNREAAALGVPVYSVFRGAMGAVDRSLVRAGRLSMITSVEQVNAIPLVARERAACVPARRDALDDIVGEIAALWRQVGEARATASLDEEAA